MGTCVGSGELRVGSAGVHVGYLDTNMLVLVTQKSRVGGIAQREPQHEGFRVAVEYGLKCMVITIITLMNKRSLTDP